MTFTKHWCSRLLKVNKDTGVQSLSPWEPNWHVKYRKMDPSIPIHYGYRPAFEVTGWCLMMHKDVINKCKLFDPRFVYWYQDNDYALTLQKYNIKHALVTNSRVYHSVSKSLSLVSKENFYHMTDGQIEVLRKKWGNNI